MDANVNEFNYSVWTDGGCAKNPNGKGGYGVVIKNNKTQNIETFSQGFLSTTNNRMEIRAIIRALQELPDNASAIIYSDSKYAVSTFNGEFKKKKNFDLWYIADELVSKKGNLVFSWVKGHADNKYNNVCYELATEAQKKSESELIADDGFVPLETKTKSTTSKSDKIENTKFETESECKNDSNSCDKIEKSVITNTKTENTENNQNEENSMKNNTLSFPVLSWPVIEPMIPDAYVDATCYEIICDINKKQNPIESDFFDLKTQFDFWSTQPLIALQFYFGNYSVSYVRSYFEKEEQVLSALRWHGRGLTIENAIRKVFLDFGNQ